MDFSIQRTITNEYSQDQLKVNLNDLEEFIEKRLEGKNYGISVVKFFWGFELFKFDSNFAQFFRNEIESWKHSTKWFVTNSNFDWNVIINLNEKETLELIRKEIKTSIERINNMKRKPKDFDYGKLAKDIDSIITEFRN